MKAPSLSSCLLWASAAVLLLGGAIGLGTLLAPMGVWLGLWDFRTGFAILGAVNPFSGPAAVLCVVGALALAGLAVAFSAGNGAKVAAFGIAGALSACLAWYIPSTFRPAEGQSFPPIHDISTDLVDIPQYVDVLPLRADAPNTTVYGGAPNMTPDRNAQLQIESYPDLVPLLLDAPWDEVFERAAAAVDEMGWEPVAIVPEEGRIEATATTFWFRFKDDVVIRIRSQGDQTRVDARSLSRVGTGDVGANAKRLREFFEILEG